MDKSKQIELLKEAFNHAVSIAVNSSQLHRNYDPKDKTPDVMHKTIELFHKSLEQALKNAGDLSGLRKKWPTNDEAIAFGHIAGNSAFEVIYKITNAVYQDADCFLIEKADDWPYFKIKSEEAFLLAQLDIETKRVFSTSKQKSGKAGDTNSKTENEKGSGIYIDKFYNQGGSTTFGPNSPIENSKVTNPSLKVKEPLYKIAHPIIAIIVGLITIFGFITGIRSCSDLPIKNPPLHPTTQPLSYR